MAKKRRDDTSLSSLLGRKREINIEEIEKATQEVHQNKSLPKKQEVVLPKVENKVEEKTKETKVDSPPKKVQNKTEKKAKPKAKAVDASEIAR